MHGQLTNRLPFLRLVAPPGMLSRPQQAQAIQRYGKILISRAPDDTTALIMDLCMPPMPRDPSLKHPDTAYTASVADFAHLYTDRPTRLLYLCEFILFNSSGEISNEQLLYHILLELYLAEKLVDQELEQGVNAAEVEPQVSTLRPVASGDYLCLQIVPSHVPHVIWCALGSQLLDQEHQQWSMLPSGITDVWGRGGGEGFCAVCGLLHSFYQRAFLTGMLDDS